jgi:ubiquinone/menaquinone biosynthesis C-methylase UbiE
MRRKEKTFSGVDKHINEILDLAYAFEKSQTLLAATQLDIFSVLGDNTMTAAEIAGEIGTDSRATERLMDALCSLGLLAKSTGKYYNTTKTKDYLVKGKPGYMGGLQHVYYLIKAWDNLVNVVINGKPSDALLFDYQDAERMKAFLRYMHWRGSMQAPYVIKRIDLSKVNKVLDLGGGTGSYAMEFLKIKPDMRVVLFEKPEVIPTARDYMEAEGFENRIETIAGDFFEDNIGNNYDLVFMSFVLENFSILDNIKLLKKVYESMNVGGKLVVQELLLDDERTSPQFNTLFSLNMLVNTEGGDAYTETDAWIMLREGWFDDIEVTKTEFDNSLIFSTKKF